MWRYTAGVKKPAEESSKEETQRGKGHKTLFNQKWRKTNTEEALDLFVYVETSQAVCYIVIMLHMPTGQLIVSLSGGKKELEPR